MLRDPEAYLMDILGAVEKVGRYTEDLSFGDFMASDMVGSPTTRPGVWIYGVLIGSLVVVIRVWGGLPEGVMYAILLGNAATPVLNQITQPKSFGRRTAERLQKASQAEKEKAS